MRLWPRGADVAAPLNADAQFWDRAAPARDRRWRLDSSLRQSASEPITSDCRAGAVNCAVSGPPLSALRTSPLSARHPPSPLSLIPCTDMSVLGRKRTCQRQTTQSRMLESAIEPKRTFASFRHGRHPTVQWFNYLVFLGLNDRSALSIAWFPDAEGLLRIICHMSNLRLGR